MVKKGGWNRFFNLLLTAVIITFFFTLLDTIVHMTIEFFEIYYYPIPHSLEFISSLPLFWYAVGKFLATIVMSIIIIPLIKNRNINLYAKSFIYTLIVVLLLQFRYYVSGYYGPIWHLYTLIMHFVILLITSIVVFRIRKTFNSR